MSSSRTQKKLGKTQKKQNSCEFRCLKTVGVVSPPKMRILSSVFVKFEILGFGPVEIFVDPPPRGGGVLAGLTSGIFHPSNRREVFFSGFSRTKSAPKHVKIPFQRRHSVLEDFCFQVRGTPGPSLAGGGGDVWRGFFLVASKILAC